MNDYYIRTFGSMGDGWRRVKGEPVQIQGFEQFDLFVHHWGDAFRISEGSSGVRMLDGFKKKELIQSLQIVMSGYAPSSILQIGINKAIQKYGLSPRYPCVMKEGVEIISS